MAETRTLPLTGAGDTTADVVVDVTPDGDAQIIKLAVSADGSSVVIPADLDGLFVQPRLEDPQDQILTATLSAGANSDLNAADIPLGKVGRLLGADIGGTIPVRCDIQVVNGSRITRTTIYTRDGETREYRPPLAKLIQVAGGVGIHFGVSVTNLSAAKTADARVTLYWDEVTP